MCLSLSPAFDNKSLTDLGFDEAYVLDLRRVTLLLLSRSGALCIVVLLIQGKPVERRGRKATGLRRLTTACGRYESGVAGNSQVLRRSQCNKNGAGGEPCGAFEPVCSIVAV